MTDEGIVPAIDGVDLSINRGEIVGVVGESGCGKSVTSLSIIGLIPKPGKIMEGSILFNGENLLQASVRRMRELRGNEIAMIFQEPMTSLNPAYTIGTQLIEGIRLQRKVSKKNARFEAVGWLKKVGIARPEQLVDEYPHRLSGGMRQRVMIAMAMSRKPQLLIADEPTTALDVTVQAQILALMKSLNREVGTAIMLITHDLGVVAETCERMVVMYAGKVVEAGTVKTLFKNPQHPYTKGLLRSAPRWDQDADRLYSIPGNVPDPRAWPNGCRFSPRCDKVRNQCFEAMPEMTRVGSDHLCRCWLLSST
ncbi:peptide ABC transporter ATP-binding protein [Ammoniphilus oxalaticus]|uniref:Peptide ABC transporter ATP-binding protein n=1 Tax=Ammoniphilus oxalaticus TaxID=66863 RepID=A0A419SEV7_9BACL|nr:ABC transporter ATP-binding protein [Ammoniphilus oxalaticus]RKD21865.1 peptide ABC transporter ATP-binding protein [Ammoniphilus oxalaticus]